MDAARMRKEFKGKKITVMGLGLLGRGTGDARFLAEQGAELIVTDLKSPEQLAPSVKSLKDIKNIRFVLGEHRLEDFRDRDLILKAPNTPPDSPYIAEARKNGIRVAMSTALFAKLCAVPCVGITGTRGKTTTTELIAHILRAAGKKVVLGGNIRGVSTLALLPEVTADSIPVLELDSWQLQGFREEGVSPHVAVFTTFFPDHMNYYLNDMDRYFADKAALFVNQKPGDSLIISEQVKAEFAARGIAPPVAPVVASAAEFANWKLGIPGEHNRENAACAAYAARVLGIEESAIREAVESFGGVPGRLELVRELRGVKIYNDTTATTPEATLAALRALDTGRTTSIILIAGGTDKGLDMRQLLSEIPEHAKRVILLAGTGTNRILGSLPDASVYDSLRTAFEEAVRYAVPGDTILFSPAFASFGMFQNEYDRGDQFTALVKAPAA